MNRWVIAVAGAVGLILVLTASGYGPHRDELYFLAAGEHLSVGYADQGPVTPLIARVMDEIAAGSLTVLRIPSALMVAAVVLLSALITRELGGRPRAQIIAAACTAAGGFVLFVGHVLSTSTFDLLVWVLISWLAIRAIRTGDDRLWLVNGLVLGLGLLNKPLPVFLALGLLAGVAIAGPRRLLRSPWVWGGAAVALALCSPWLIWQSSNGWPQLDVAREIAEGGSISSEPWWAVVPFQALLASPPLAPVWIAGLFVLFRSEALRPYRFLGWTWAVLAGVFMATGGKPYYLAGLLPVLIAAGAIAAEGWLERGRAWRRVAVAGVTAISFVVAATISLPLLPEDDAGLPTAANADVGETIGWPELVDTVASAYRETGPGTVIFTENYGEAGAIDWLGSGEGLPGAYSGHNAYWDWGPPPDGSAPVVAVGFTREFVDENFEGCLFFETITNEAGIENDEEGKAVWTCTTPRGEWSDVWPALQRLG